MLVSGGISQDLAYSKLYPNPSPKQALFPLPGRLLGTGGEEQKGDEGHGNEEKQQREAQDNRPPERRSGDGRGRRQGDVEGDGEDGADDEEVGRREGQEDGGDGHVEDGAARGGPLQEVQHRLQDLPAAEGDVQGRHCHLREVRRHVRAGGAEWVSGCCQLWAGRLQWEESKWLGASEVGYRGLGSA